MKGLILKDVYNLSGQIKIYLLMPIMAAFFCYQNQSLSFAQFMLSIIVMFIPLSAFAYDEMCSFDSYAMTLPITRKDLVLSRYILTLVTILVVCCIACLTAFLLVSLFGVDYFQEFTWRSFIEEEIAVCLALNAITCILLPLVFKYGSEKGRIVLFLVFMGIGILPFLFKEQLSSLSFDGLQGSTMLWIAAIVLLLIETVSLYLSMRIVEKKEF